MSNWTEQELAKMAKTDELRISSRKSDGTLRNPVIIWAVQVDNAIYVRAVRGREGAWWRHTQEAHQGHISCGGVHRDVSISDAPATVTEAVSAAFRAKYRHYPSTYVDSTLTPKAVAATLRLVPS